MAWREYKFRDGKLLRLGGKTCVMGILNVTEDSFSDGGKFSDIAKAAAQAEKLAADGAAIIDIGAESTRPGAKPLTAEEETRRLLPFLRHILPSAAVPLSVDTYHTVTARAALEAGADIINDVGGLGMNGENLPDMMGVAKEFDAPLIVTHGGDADTSRVVDIVACVGGFFARVKEIAADIGFPPKNLLFDPGIGFTGKTTAQNLTLIKNWRRLKTLAGEDYPLVLGASRKRFIGEVLNAPTDKRVLGTAAVCAAAVLGGCEIVRVHDAREIVDACQMIDAIKNAGD